VKCQPRIIGAHTQRLAAMCLPRFKAADGPIGPFLTGTDEHARSREISPGAARTPDLQPMKLPQNFRKLAEDMNYLLKRRLIRTTEDRQHSRSAGDLAGDRPNGHIYLDSYSRLVTRCAKRGVLTANPNSPKVRVAGKPRPPRPRSNGGRTEYSSMSKCRTLLEFYAANPDFIGPDTRRNEVVSFVSGGLKDSRSAATISKMGIPVAQRSRPHHVCVLGALTNYLTAVAIPMKENPDYAKFWPAEPAHGGAKGYSCGSMQSYWPASPDGRWPVRLPKRV